MPHDATTWTLLYLASEWVVRLVMLAVIPLRRDPNAAKGWLLLVFFMPWFGLLLFLLWGSPRMPRWREDKLLELARRLETPFRLRRHPHIIFPRPAPEFEDAVRLAVNLGHLPILGGNRVELLSDYDGTIQRIVDDIDAARHHVHLLFYIFGDDSTSARVIEALARAANRGVRCRVLIDSVGSRPALSRVLPKLAAAGVEARAVLPLGLFRRKLTRFDLRNHRKLVVIDGQIAYTGSQNLVAAGFREGLTNEELMARVGGPVALEMQYVFVVDWFLETDQLLDDTSIFPEPTIAGQVAAQVVPSGPDYPTPALQRLLITLVHGARQRLVLTTPYFIPDEPLLQALETAVLRGVEVHLVLSDKADQFFVCQAQRSYYDELLVAGVRIHLYGRKFLHAKHVSIDDAVMLVGSSNLDIRSFLLNAEIMLAIYDNPTVARLRALQDRCLAQCRELSLDAWRQRPYATRFVQNLARLVSPLL